MTTLEVAVVGSGPAGIYTAEALIKQVAALAPAGTVRVDVLDRLPTPYGLVRYGVAGGFGDAVCRLLRDEGVATPARTFGIPQRFLAHGSRDEILDEVGLVPQHLARQITEAVAQLDPVLADNPRG